MTELPYQAEYAKTGRAACKGCKQKIDQGALRMAIMVQSAFFDGKQPNWHHEECFFKKQHPTTISDIGNFNKLQSADQKRIKSIIENSTDIVMPVEKPKGKGKSKKRAADNSSAESTALALKDYLVEYSKSSRATCKHCEIKICKDEVRICKKVHDTEVGKRYGGESLWHHVKCFAERRSELLFFAGGESLPGFKSLKKKDQAIVKAEIKPFKADEVPVKKLKAEPRNEDELKEQNEKEKKLDEQNKLFHEYRKALTELKNNYDLKELLEVNSQEVPPGRDEGFDHLADCMAFGVLKPCKECKNGQLVLDTFGYKCTGSISEWTKCSYVTQNPERVPMIVPKEYAEVSIFKRYKPKTDVRLFETQPQPQPVVVKNETATTVKKEMPAPPLKNLKFFFYGKLKNKEETKKRILKLGGLVVSKLTTTTVAVVSTKRDVERMPERMEEIKSMDIEVVEESFLDLIKQDGTIATSLELIKENNIAEWGSDPATRVPQDVVDGKSIPKSGSMYVKSSKSAVKLKIQAGTAVDPASKLQDEAHVYIGRDGTKYTVVLSQTDVVAQKNSFYKMQVLKSDSEKKYWLFRSWGRIGTTAGGSKVEEYQFADDAILKFEELYKEKTKNVWEHRDRFTKVPGRYFPLDMDYGTDDVSSQTLDVDDECDLPVPVQKLVINIFDVDVMRKTLLEFELDTEKMPLGKLSKNQIMSGYKILSEVLKLIEEGSTSKAKLVDATNRFFTLIPHDFGMNNAPLLDNVELVKTKTAMLDNLLEIEIAYSLLKSDSTEGSPISAHYLKLKASIAPLPTSSPEFEMIQEYLRNTHAATHSSYTLHIEEVFKVVREGEDERFKPFKKLHNRRLLWHGSRITNFAGIISQGLRIAPPEAPATGYMFGKGVYFADMASKSANYCCTNVKNPTGLMLLCEVALGNMKECYFSEDVKLPPNMHSAWGVGSTQPDPARARLLPDGTLVPLGKPVANSLNGTLLYNEFIVYDVAQVNVKYLLQLKFNYKYY